MDVLFIQTDNNDLTTLLTGDGWMDGLTDSVGWRADGPAGQPLVRAPHHMSVT